jgi:uncharacterized membrane-anchored protein YjiN (DUF445 family)
MQYGQEREIIFMVFNSSNTVYEKYKKNKLKKMKFISTGLLVLVLVLYFICKKFKIDQSNNLLYSSMAAFTEASIVGAFADWFAVVALFKHPLGLSVIPHTAIIKKNKNEIAESLSKFVVENFFTDEKIMEILKNIQFSKEFNLYLNEKKEYFSNKVIENIPSIAVELSKIDYIKKFVKEGLNNSIKDKVELSPIAGRILEGFILSTENNVKLVKVILEYILNELQQNQQTFINFIQQQKLFNIIGFTNSMAQGIHSKMTSIIQNEINNINNNNSINGGLSKILLDKLQNIAFDLKKSDAMIKKGNELKNNILKSEAYENFIDNNILYTIILNSTKNPEQITDKIISFIDVIIIKGLFESKEICEQIDNWAKSSIANVISSNKSYIGELISKTVKEWPDDEMVEKLEMQVGSDLQYIRINGTIVGGLFGVLLNLMTHLLGL